MITAAATTNKRIVRVKGLINGLPAYLVFVERLPPTSAVFRTRHLNLMGLNPLEIERN